MVQKNTQILDVYLQERLAGQLTYHDGALSFAYDPAYLQSGTARKLSASLPLQAEPFGHAVTSPFFSNLLPDEKVRVQLARYLHISKENTFGLLKEIGGECAGAVALYPTGCSPHTMEPSRYRVLEENEADKILSSLDKQPLLAGEEDIRLSSAGAQNKLIIAFQEEKIAIPLGNTASTHIIKPAIAGIEDTVFNELFCMRLAQAVGLPVPATQILYVKDKPYYVVQRYDRYTDEKGLVHRLHQEDFCQALNIPPEQKYENEGGPSLQQCFALLEERIATGNMAGINRLILLKGVMFNFLIGNGDAHGKNFSLLYKDSGESLAPFYDLLCTKIYSDSYKTTMAMKIGRKDMFKDVYPRHWGEFSASIGIKPDFVLRQLQAMCMHMQLAAETLKNNLIASGFASPVYDQIIAVIQKHVKQSALNP